MRKAPHNAYGGFSSLFFEEAVLIQVLVCLDQHFAPVIQAAFVPIRAMRLVDLTSDFTGAQSGRFRLVMCASFPFTLLRYSTLRMCHFDVYLINYPDSVSSLLKLPRTHLVPLFHAPIALRFFPAIPIPQSYTAGDLHPRNCTLYRSACSTLYIRK